MGISGSAEQRQALQDKIDFDLKKVKIEKHVKTTEDAYHARTATMYDGEYAQLDDQVHVAT